MSLTNAPQSPVQEKLARTISIIVLSGTCLFGLLGIAMAIIAMSIDHGDTAKAKDILQTLFSAILPLFGTWIGTILAFYFSKENLLAANQTVQYLVNKITSEKKLESIKSKDIMIPIEKLIYKPYPTGTDDSALNLKTDFLDFISQNKISRVLLLDENKLAKYVIHKSTIESFITDAFFSPSFSAETASKEIKALTFADMKKSTNPKIQSILMGGIKYISTSSNLADAKLLMKNSPECNDVFITENGTGSSPVLGWITEKTIAENSVVD